MYARRVYNYSPICTRRLGSDLWRSRSSLSLCTSASKPRSLSQMDSPQRGFDVVVVVAAAALAGNQSRRCFSEAAARRGEGD